MSVDPWELLREAEKTVFEWFEMGAPIDMDVFDRISTALKARSEQNKPLPRDVLCPKCGTPKTNPYKCELCSEYWGP
jgi:hypothetical protein